MSMGWKNTGMRVRSIDRANPALLGIFWFGIQAVWGAILGISLQSRTSELAPGHALVSYGFIAACGAAIAAITQLAVGAWSDRRVGSSGRRIEFYVAGAVVAACALVMFYRAPSFIWLLASFGLLQFGMNIAIGPYQAIIPDFVERRRVGGASAWMAALQSAGNAAGALAAARISSAPLLGGILALTVLATCVVTALHALKLRVRVLETAALTRRGGRAFLDLFVSRALVYVGFYTLLGYLYFYLRAMPGAGDSSARAGAGVLIFLFTALGVGGAVLAGRPSDRTDKRLVATAGTAAVIAALLIFASFPSVAATYLATVIAGVGWGVFLVADWALGCRVVRSDARARAMAIWNLAVVGPQIAAPALATLVLGLLGLLASPLAARAAFVLAALEVAGGSAWLWYLPASVARD
jgi:MFS family permease